MLKSKMVQLIVKYLYKRLNGFSIVTFINTSVGLQKSGTPKSNLNGSPTRKKND